MGNLFATIFAALAVLFCGALISADAAQASVKVGVIRLRCRRWPELRVRLDSRP